jgi:hypothetical protein
MGAMRDIQRAVSDLSNQELAEFRAWFLDFDGEAWDRKIEDDAAAGRLDALADEAMAEFGVNSARKRAPRRR